MSNSKFNVTWYEDSSALVLGRLTSPDGTGGPTGIPLGGYWLKPADIGSIACSVYDLDSEDPKTIIASPTVDRDAAVLDPPKNDVELWDRDAVGYNFRHPLGPENFPIGGHRYSVVYTVTTVSGARFHAEYKGPATPILSR